jgi:hypothetical protein
MNTKVRIIKIKLEKKELKDLNDDIFIELIITKANIKILAKTKNKKIKFKKESE